MGQWPGAVEALGVSAFWQRRRVLVTGHTGFKGSWLVSWLLAQGALVSGYALAPPTTPSLFACLGLAEEIDHHLGDVRDLARLRAVLRQAAPDVVFHLAAQALVRAGYQRPVETFATNVMGTVHLLDAVRAAPTVRAVVCIASDKVYENADQERAHREGGSLGGRDPYSASKSCAELAVTAYRHAFFAGGFPLVATARAGNVIGGGDWAADRLVPDIIAALQANRPARIRNPRAIRPWQHVLDPLAGYAQLAERLAEGDSACAEAWNFGADPEHSRPVSWLADQLCALWPSGAWATAPDDGPHETAILRLDSTKAHRELGWRPRWSLERTLAETVAWHRTPQDRAALRAITAHQIAAHAAHPIAAREPEPQCSTSP